nr:MAG TPA: hypothetical protein [Caudoviricetes sp.]
MTTSELITALQRLNVETGSIACLGCGHEHNCGIHGCAIIREAVHRLYNFYAVFNEDAVVRLTARCLKVEPARLRELAEADKAGRVVVLPCKDWLNVVFGDQVLFWGIDKNCMENPIREISVDDAERITWYDGYKTVYLKGTDENEVAWEFYPEEIGKTVFLTREEAEKALEAMKDE